MHSREASVLANRVDTNNRTLYCLIDDSFLESAALVAALQDVALALPGADFTRMDVSFADDAALRRGEFKLFEADLPPFGTTTTSVALERPLNVYCCRRPARENQRGAVHRCAAREQRFLRGASGQSAHRAARTGHWLDAPSVWSSAAVVRHAGHVACGASLGTLVWRACRLSRFADP